MANPLLSIVIPVYNATPWLERTIASLDQIAEGHRARCEAVFVDDGSSDHSAEFVEQIITSRKLTWMRLIRKTNGGSASARNQGLREARGDWVFFLDADDELACDLTTQIDSAPHASCILMSTQFVRPGTKPRQRRPPRIDPHDTLTCMTAGNPVVISSIVLRRSGIDHLFDERFLSREDWHFWMQNPRVFTEPVRRPQVTASIIHAHGGNKSANYARAGRFRAMVADAVLNETNNPLTKKQSNNLAIQKKVGKLQQEPRIGFSHLMIWPCSLSLWLKSVVYGFGDFFVQRLDPYR